MGPQVQGVSKKTSFSQNCPWQILLLIMRNPLSFFMTNVGDSFCNSYIYHLVGLHISDIGKEISSLVTCWGLWTATVPHSWAALWVLVIDPPQSKRPLVQIPDYPLTWNPCIWKLGSKVCREPRQKVLGTPPTVEHHCKKGSLRGLVFYLYLQNFPMDFSLSTVIFATANFDKRKFFLRHHVV